MKSPYDIRTEETRMRLDSGRDSYSYSYSPNRFYISLYGDIYYINTKGYYHILTLGKDSTYKKYALCDYLLKADNSLEMTSSKLFDSKKDIMNYIDSNIAF